MEQSLPYNNTRDDIFWRTGVASVDIGTDLFCDLVPKLSINHDSKISSAGSCFAQHIGKWLIDNNYKYLQSELNTEQVSSFAFGNLYTARSFLQWLTLTPTELAQFSIYYDCEAQRFFDLLLPTALSEGYESRGALMDYRIRVINEAKSQIAKSDCFIFTLGLTEAWTDPSGICYPVCPGIRNGKYDANTYKIKGLKYNEIYADLTSLYLHLQSINPQLKLVLTVSPVPLTATAMDKHVLVANCNSKSVLRAVAGDFCDATPGSSYFPSFEIITATNTHDFRFLSNRRTVSAEGVSYVMRHWAALLGDNHATTQPAEHFDADCDEEMLNTLQKLAQSRQMQSSSPQHLTLIGDSHLAKLANALERKKIPFCGGMVMNGSGFAQHKFCLSEDADIMIPLESASSRQLWIRIANNLQQISHNGTSSESCIITNIGLQTHQTVAMFIEWIQEVRPEKLHQLSLEDYIDFFHVKQQDQMTIIFKLRNLGHRVIVVSDTPFSRYFEESQPISPFVMAYMDALKYVWEQLGIEFFHAARCFEEEIADPVNYTSTLIYSDGSHDWSHGGEKYYDWLATKLLEQIT